MQSNRRFIIASAIAGLVASLGDFAVTLILGVFYPNYNHFKLVMSELGTAQSPVATWINLWWLVFGILFIIFGLGFRKAFTPANKVASRAVTVASLLIMVFGLGAGIGSGLFPMDPVGSEATLAGELHDMGAGLGFLALMFVPLVSLAIFPRKRSPTLYRFSLGTFGLGLVLLILFIMAEDASSADGILSYVGLWQRLFLLNIYLYLGMIAVKMLRSSQKKGG
jgi:hypothetical membrane protein